MCKYGHKPFFSFILFFLFYYSANLQAASLTLDLALVSDGNRISSRFFLDYLQPHFYLITITSVDIHWIENRAVQDKCKCVCPHTPDNPQLLKEAGLRRTSSASQILCGPQHGFCSCTDDKREERSRKNKKEIN